MPSLIPSLNSCVARMTSGEKRFAVRLEQNLDDDYLIWYDVPIGKKQLHPDFIVLHPLRGLLRMLGLCLIGRRRSRMKRGCCMWR